MNNGGLMSMKITGQSNFANTAIVGNITYRVVGTHGLAIGLGIVLFQTPVFKWNIPAMIAYIALASIVVGSTPTNRTIMYNLMGLLFKKPIKMVITNMSTRNTFGHGVREVLSEPEIDVPMSKMGSGQVALVYNITSGLNQWSSEDEYNAQAIKVKGLFNIFEGSESLMIITKADADTGMLKLEEALEEMEDYEGDDLEALAAGRRDLLHRVATQEVGRSVQQYGVLKVKRKNVTRCVKALSKCCRIMRPATNPGDILLSSMGLEAGAEQDAYEEYED